MYPNLFKGPGLKSQDLIKYDTPLVSFNGRVVIPEGQISLPVNMEGKKVMVTFIIVSLFSPYTAILGRPYSRNGGYSIHVACESQVLYRTRCCCSSGKSESGQAMPSFRS